LTSGKIKRVQTVLQLKRLGILKEGENKEGSRVAKKKNGTRHVGRGKRKSTRLKKKTPKKEQSISLQSTAEREEKKIKGKTDFRGNDSGAKTKKSQTRPTSLEKDSEQKISEKGQKKSMKVSRLGQGQKRGEWSLGEEGG